MTPEQLTNRNRRIAEGARISWLNDDVRNRRVKAIIAAKDDPLHRAMQSARAKIQAKTRSRDDKGRWT
ncbi:MAG: hypothetical protein KGL39_05110 [Patescibacteria group bacterium]|nr:hypothetical protein [Patescibacteria group bacterium]